MSFVNQINDLKTRMNVLKTHEFVSEGSYLIEGLVSELTEMSSRMKNAFGEYFNEYGLSTPEMGEGMHFMTGNGYSSSIPLSFDYYKIRELMLDNFTKYTNDETSFIKNIRTKLDNFENSTLPEWERMYEEYQRNPPIPPADPDGGVSEPLDPPIPSTKDFWTRYGLKDQFSTMITAMGTQAYQCIEQCKALIREIHNWFDLGMDVSMTVAVAQHINSLPAEVYNKICGSNKNAVRVYSQKMYRALVTTDKIRARYPDSSIAKQNLCLRDVVCNQLNVKDKSTTIYNNIKNIFQQFGISSRNER